LFTEKQQNHLLIAVRTGKIAVMDRKSTSVDEIDGAIIEQLQVDGRVSYTKLGTAIGLSEAAARQRVQRLIDGGVIQIVAVTNPLSLGYRRMAMIGVRAEGPTDAIAAALEGFSDIEYLVATAGSFDLLCEVVVPDDSTLLEVTNRIRSVPGVRSTETFIYLSLIKQNYAWGAH
jgi:Lrp/AsnC family transcriptional regulator for asnA, asnC and gidA